MGVVQLPDEIHRVVERQVAEGRASSTTAFLEEAVLRLVDACRLEEEELTTAVGAGLADLETQRYSTIATPEQGRDLHEAMMRRLRAHLAADR